MSQAPEHGGATQRGPVDRHQRERARAWRALGRAREAQRRLRLLTAATEILASSLNHESILIDLAKMIVSHYADTCSVHLVDETGHVRQVALEHAESFHASEAKGGTEEASGPSLEATFLRTVIATQKPVIYNESDWNQAADGSGADRLLGLMRRAELKSMMSVPMIAGSKVLGALTICRGGKEARGFTKGDLAVAMDLARRAAMAVDHARMRQEVKRSLASLKLALESGQMAIWEWWVASDRIVCSPQFGAMHGSSESMPGHSLKELVGTLHPDDQDDVFRSIYGAAAREEPFSVEYRYIDGHGQLRWLQLKGDVMERGTDGEPARYAGTCTDVTEQKRVEQALRDSNEKLRAVIEASPLPIVAMDAEGRITEWNGAAEHITGWRKDEVIGRANPMIPGADGRDEALWERMRRGEHLRGILVKRKRRDGGHIHLSKWATPILGPQGEVAGVVAIYMDVTERTRFLRIAAHELGNPLASIKALCSLLRFYVSTGKPLEALADPIERLHREVDSFSDLLSEIIEVFRTQEGQWPIRPERVEATDILSQVVEAFRPVAVDHQVTFEVAGDRPAWIWADVRRLEQLIRNLLFNAVKYSPDGGEISVKVETSSQAVRISVSDQGIGIPKREFSRLFEAFYRIEESQRYHTGGMGLGLYICRDIVLQHGGRIWVESEVGVGSTFFVELPLAN